MRCAQEPAKSSLITVSLAAFTSNLMAILVEIGFPQSCFPPLHPSPGRREVEMHKAESFASLGLRRQNDLPHNLSG